MPEQDLAQLIRGLSPGALTLFKRQIANLPQKERELAFSRLSGIEELSDITGRPTIQPKMAEQPLWQKGLQTISEPFNWISRRITEPFGAVATSPFTPGLPGGRQPGESSLAYARRQYEQWQEPTWTMPWGAEFRPTKGIVETLPWFALPTAGGVVGRLGGLAAKGGALGKAAGYGAAALKPVAVAEQVLNPFAWQREISRLAAKRAGGKIVGKTTGKVTPAPEVTKERQLRQQRNILQSDIDIVIQHVRVTSRTEALAIPKEYFIKRGENYFDLRKLSLQERNFVERRMAEIEQLNAQIVKEVAIPKAEALPGKVIPTPKTIPSLTQAFRTRAELDAMPDASLAREIGSRHLTSVSPFGAGQQEFLGTYLSTEASNRYMAVGKTLYEASVKSKSPKIFRSSVEYSAFREKFLPPGVGLEEATEEQLGRAVRDATSYLKKQGFDSVYLPESEMNEGILVVFDKAGVSLHNPTKITEDFLRREGEATASLLRIVKAGKVEPTAEALPGKVIGAGLGKIIPKVGKEPSKMLSEMFPAGLPEEQEVATKWLTDLTRKSKPLTKETLELRKPEHAARAAEYERLLQEKIAKGVPIKQAEEEATQQALYGVYSKAPLTPAFLEQLKEQGKYEATLLRMIADANFKYGFERKNAFSAFWDLLNEGHLQMNQIQTLERVFGSELAKALLEKNRTLGQKIWFNTIDAINIPRGLLSMADMSGFGRQGWILTTTRPDRAVKAVMPMIESMFSEKNAMFLDDVFLNRKHIDKVMRLRPDFLTKWAGEATDIVAREEGFASRWLNKMPVVGQIYKGSTRAYTTVLNDLRTANVSAAISGWEKNGFKYLDLDEAAKLYGNNARAIFDAKFYTDVDIDMLARTVSWASGRGSLPPELARHAGIANAVFFAPKLIASRLEFPFAVLPGVNPSRLARQEAARELLSFIGTGGGILGMAVLSDQGEVELDPRSPDFAKLKVEDTRLDIWTGYAQYLRFIAQMATAQGKTQSGRITTKDRGELIGRFAQSKLSPAAGFITDLVKEETYLGEDMPPRSAKSVLGQIYNRMMPLAIQDMVDGYLEDSWSGGIVSSLSFYGVGVVTYTDEVKRARDKVAQKEFGMSWDEVGTKYGRATQLKLEQTPTIIEAEKEHEERFAGGTPTSMDNFRNEGKLVEDTYRKDVDNAVREFRVTKNGKLFREKITDASRGRRDAYSLRAKKAEYQDIIAYYNQPIPADKLAEMNPGDVLRREYYKQMFDPIKMYDEFGNYRFDEADKIEQEFVVKHGQQAMDYIEEYQGARWLDKPVELKMLEEAKELLRPYWDITDKVWAMYPEGLQEISDQIKVMENGTDEQQRMAKMELRKYPAILRARELIARYKAQMRQYSPMINQAYKMYY